MDLFSDTVESISRSQQRPPSGSVLEDYYFHVNVVQEFSCLLLPTGCSVGAFVWGSYISLSLDYGIFWELKNDFLRYLFISTDRVETTTTWKYFSVTYKFIFSIESLLGSRVKAPYS